MNNKRNTIYDNSRAGRMGDTLDDTLADDELIKMSLAGSTSSFSALISRYQATVLSYCGYHMRTNRSSAEDIAQETFFRAFEKLESFRGDSTFRSWLLKIAINLIRDYSRKTNRWTHLEYTENSEKGSDRHIQADCNTVKEAKHADSTLEQREIIINVLGQLSEEYRSLLLLKEYQGFTLEELSNTFDCSIDSIKGKLSRARSAANAIWRQMQLDEKKSIESETVNRGDKTT